MNVGETNHFLRRIPLVVRLDDGVTLATNADSSPPAHALQVSINGSAYVDAAGSFFGDGSGLYWYEATLTEASTQGFLAFKYQATGFKTETVTQNVGPIFTVGETIAAHLRWPILIYQDDGVTPATGVAVSPPAHYLQTSSAGAAFGDAAGSLVEVGSGLYYYQGASADAAAATSLGIKVARSGVQTTMSWVAVEAPASSADASAPVVTAVTPSTDTAPGAVGGMPLSYPTAAATPIALTITDADGASDLAVIQISALYLDGSASETIYRDGAFEPGFANSQRTSATSGFQFTLSRDAGWPAAARTGDLAVSIAVIAVDAAGNTADVVLRYQMPARAAAAIPFTQVAADGAVDLFAEARGLVVWQLRA